MNLQCHLSSKQTYKLRTQSPGTCVSSLLHFVVTVSLVRWVWLRRCVEVALHVVLLLLRRLSHVRLLPVCSARWCREPTLLSSSCLFPQSISILSRTEITGVTMDVQVGH